MHTVVFQKCLEMIITLFLSSNTNVSFKKNIDQTDTNSSQRPTLQADTVRRTYIVYQRKQR